MSKETFRTALIERRASLVQERRMQASKLLFSTLSTISSPFVLSFASFGHEIDLWDLNALLAKRGELLLPRVNGDDLEIYRVFDLKNELLRHPFGFFEPNPHICEKIAPEKIKLALVPALGFDTFNHRLGHGKGYYDRFLKKITGETLGIGFKEQFVEKLPHASHDVALSRLALF